MLRIAIALCLFAAPVAAADLPVPKPAPAAIAKDKPTKRHLTQKQFEDILLSPIGKGRLE